jgi:hypothetical protein
MVPVEEIRKLLEGNNCGNFPITFSFESSGRPESRSNGSDLSLTDRASILEGSDDMPEPSESGLEGFLPDEGDGWRHGEAVPNQTEVVVFSIDKATQTAHPQFRLTRREPGFLFDSPLVMHPTHNMLVWPLSSTEIVFADFANKTYFTRFLGCGAPKTCHISIQPRFSPCEKYLHLACIDAQSEAKLVPGTGGKDKLQVVPAVCGFHLRVSTFQLSESRPTRCPPRLVYRATAKLNHHLLDDAEHSVPVGVNPVSYTLTWTADHVYATESYRILRVVRLPLWQQVEEREREQASPQTRSGALDDELDEGAGKGPEPAFANDAMIFLPESADRRPVRFFPTVPREVKASKKGSEKAESKGKSKGKGKRGREDEKEDQEVGEGEDDPEKSVVATIVISCEDSIRKVQPYKGPPQVVCVSAAEFGGWKRLQQQEDSGDGITPLRRTRTWKGGHLEAKCEKFLQSDCADLVPTDM